ncbi:MAG: hypothetical protein JNM69_10175 [Archangium sp.]|nr:hypothetical protein [Archangium sp.]
MRVVDENAPNPMAAPPPGGGGGGKAAAAVVIVVLVLGLCCVAVVLFGVSFAPMHRRPKASEAKANLKTAFTAEKVFFAEHGRYSPYIEEVGFLPEANNRFLYALAADGDLASPPPRASAERHTGVHSDPRHRLSDAALEAKVPDALWDEVGLSGKCPSCDITIIAVSNLDSDDDVDVWSISTRDRTIEGVRVTAGTPHQHLDDSK